MSASSPVRSFGRRRRQLVELLKVQAVLAVREPYALGAGIALPVGLLIVFGFIGQSVPGNVGDTGLTIIDLWTPTIMVLAFLFIAASLPNTLVRDREIGWLRRVSTTPLHPFWLLAAQLVLNLILAIIAIAIILVGGALLFGASLHVAILPFVAAIVLAIADLFALGLMMVALAPSQTVASTVAGAVTLALMFLSGLWIQPAQAGEPLATIMHFSPSGAAVRAVLDAAFNGGPSYAALATLVVYTLGFGYVAVRYFRWE